MGVKASFAYNTVLTMEQQNLEQIYVSDQAKAYQRGGTDCDDCRLRPVCGGCLAVTYGWGLDPLRTKDPACFL